MLKVSAAAHQILTIEQVRVMRRMYLEGNITQRELADTFGLSISGTNACLRLTTYKDAGVATTTEMENYLHEHC